MYNAFNSLKSLVGIWIAPQAWFFAPKVKLFIMGFFFSYLDNFRGGGAYAGSAPLVSTPDINMYLYTLKFPNMLQQKSQYPLSRLHGNKHVLAEIGNILTCENERLCALPPFPEIIFYSVHGGFILLAVLDCI